jgi:hypothetical protein
MIKRHVMGCGVVGMLLLGTTLPVAAAGVPRLLPFNATVRVAGTNYSGTVALKFAIVATAAPTVNRWANDGTVAGEPAQATPAHADNGVCRLALGDTALAHMQALAPTVFADATPLALRVWLQAGAGPCELLDPDTPLLPTAYAFNAALLDGQSAQAFSSTAATYQLAAQLAGVVAVLPALSNELALVQTDLADEAAQRLQADAHLSNILEDSTHAWAVTTAQVRTELTQQLASISNQFEQTAAGLSADLANEAAQRGGADSNLAMAIAVTLQSSSSLVAQVHNELVVQTAVASNTFLRKAGDSMTGPLQVAQILMIGTNIPGYHAAGISAAPEANGFYRANGLTNCHAPVFENGHGIYLYRHEIDDDGLYTWRIGPNCAGTPYYAVQQYSQDVVPPLNGWDGCTLTAAVWTNRPVIDFAGGTARNLAPATAANDAATLGQLISAQDAASGAVRTAVTTFTTNLAALAADLVAATNAVADAVRRLAITRTEPTDLVITSGMHMAAARDSTLLGQSFVARCNATVSSVHCWPATPAVVQRAELYCGVMWLAPSLVGSSMDYTDRADGARMFTFAPDALAVSSGQVYTIVFTLTAGTALGECPGSGYPHGDLCTLLTTDGEQLWAPDGVSDLGVVVRFVPVERTRISAEGITVANGARITLNGQDIDARFLNAAGDTLLGDLNANQRRITNLPVPAAPNEPATKTYADGATNAVSLALHTVLTGSYATRAYVDTKQYGTANLANGAVTLAKLQTSSVDARYIATTGAQALQGPLTLAGAGDWRVGSAQTRADVALQHPAGQVRNAAGDLTLAAAATHAIHLQSFAQLSAEQVGRATVLSGDDAVQVTDKPVTAAALILLTPCGAVPGTPYIQIDGATFWIKLPAPAAQDTAINYLILRR